jgi:hypothetical protein
VQRSAEIFFDRSAELHSAVSQNWILQGVRRIGRSTQSGSLAECNSAIQQITNLRYDGFDCRRFRSTPTL